jgi:hypothetical protein
MNELGQAAKWDHVQKKSILRSKVKKKKNDKNDN